MAIHLVLPQQQCKRLKSEAPHHSSSWTPTSYQAESGQKAFSCPTPNQSLHRLCQHLLQHGGDRNHSHDVSQDRKLPKVRAVLLPNSFCKKHWIPELLKSRHTVEWS